MLIKYAALSAPVSQTYVDDVFVSYVRAGTGASQTTTTNIDMTQGYALWTKGRSGATGHSIYHSARGVTKDLVTNTTAAETTEAQGLTAVSSTSHTYGTLAKVNTRAATYVDWVLCNAPKFYHHTTLVKTGGSNATYDFSTLTTLGMVRVKRTDSIGSWYVWHRSLTTGNLLIGEATNAEAVLGHIRVSGTTLTLVDGVIANGTYLVEAWAHDTSATGLIQCGSFTTDGSGDATVTLGWEPQYILYKTTGIADDWSIVDSSRVFPATANCNELFANSSVAEIVAGGDVHPTATGFTVFSGFGNSASVIYLAIRRPNKPPTVGTQVYNAIARTGTGAAATVTGVGFAPDLVITRHYRSVYNHYFWDRLRGANRVLASIVAAAAEISATDAFNSFNMDGISLGADPGQYVNKSGADSLYYFFRRAPGVFDEVCYTGTGANKTETHNLTVAPELWIVKGRSGATAWMVGCTALANTEYLVLNTGAAKATDATAWNSTFPTSSVFSIGTQANVNTNTRTHVAYLFATLAGISKVGSYTGNGTTQTINCGFSAGARFVLIKRTDSTGDWYIWDTVRGIIAGNDPHLSLNTTAAQVTTDDSIDPDASGFIVNQLAATNINVSSASYIFLSIA